MTVKPLKTHIVSLPPLPRGVEIPAAMASLGERYDQVDVVAASVGWVTPLDLCGLRALIDIAATRSTIVNFDCPTNRDVHRYLARMDFYAALPSNVCLSREVPNHHRNTVPGNIIELRRVSTPDEAEALMEVVWQVASNHFGKGPMAKACATAIAAASENVLDHGNSSFGGLVAAQHYKETGLELAVVDQGVGIPTTLRAKPKYRFLSDLEALAKALEDGVTSTNEAGGGLGLSELVTTARRAGNATLVIQSGLGQYTISSRNGSCSEYRTTPGCPIPGTWISLRLQP